MASSFPRLHDHIQVDASQSLGLPWKKDRLDAEASTWQHTALATDRHPCPLRKSSPQRQQASGLKPTALDCAATGIDIIRFNILYIYIHNFYKCKIITKRLLAFQGGRWCRKENARFVNLLLVPKGKQVCSLHIFTTCMSGTVGRSSFGSLHPAALFYLSCLYPPPLHTDCHRHQRPLH